MKQLHGDGVRDDTEALQALVDGETVMAPDGTLLCKGDGAIQLPVGIYRAASVLRGSAQ